MNMEKHEKKTFEYDVAIIGGGPAGLSAAVYCRRSGLKTVVLESGNWGGAICQTEEVENYPAVSSMSGPELGKLFTKQAEAFGADLATCFADSIKFDDKYKVIYTSRDTYRAKAVIIATGSVFSHLGCPGEMDYIGRGVSYCATCDAPFTQDCRVAVIGGGNTAVEEGTYLTKFAQKVFIIHRRDTFRADAISVERLKNNPKIEPIYDTVATSICGDGDLITKVVLKNVKTGKISELPVDFVFIFVGSRPNNQLVKYMVKCAENGGWIETDSSLATSVPGIFAAGDVRRTPLRQVVTAASDGAVAAHGAYKYITENF